MLGLNHRVRKVPVSSRTTKLHRAISPSMKDQWSGKTLRTCFFASVASPTRSSIQLAAPATRFGLAGFAAVRPLVLTVLISSPTFPVAGADRLVEVRLGDEVALAVDHDRKLGQRTSCRSEDHLTVVRQVEGRLVTGAQQVVRLLLPKRDRAPDVGADLGEAQDAFDTPVLAAGGGGDVAGPHPDDDGRGLGLGLLERGALVDRVAVLLLEEHTGFGVDELADLDVLGPDRGAGHVVDHPHALGPDGVGELVARQGT